MRNHIVLESGTHVTKNFEIDRLIDEPIHLIKAANAGEAIYVRTFGNTKPAAFLVSWQFRMVVRWMNSNNFYTIKKITK